MADDDFLTDVWRILAPVVGHAAADRELLELRRRWGGTRIYLKRVDGWPEIVADPRPRRPKK